MGGSIRPTSPGDNPGTMEVTMSRIRISVLAAAAFAVMAMSAIAAQSASATFVLVEKECGPGLPALCENVGGILWEWTGKEKVTGTLETTKENKLKANLGEEVILKSSSAALTAEVDNGKPLEGTAATITGLVIEFKGVKITGNAAVVKKCKIASEIVLTKPLKGTFEDADPVAKTHFEPENAEKIFAEFEFINNGAETCPATIKGVRKVKGKQLVTNITPETHATVHLLEATEAQSELTIGENAATFEGTFEVKLENQTAEWDIALA